MNSRDINTHTPRALGALADVQGAHDGRRIAIDRVGVKGVRHPVRIVGHGGAIQPTVATFDLYVALPHDQKGAHMSRFVELLNGHAEALSPASFRQLVRTMTARLEASAGDVTMRFPYFVTKHAPVTGIPSLMDYTVTFAGSRDAVSEAFTLTITAPVTSLCPCSKEISEYGAHNQRSHITIAVRAHDGDDLDIESLLHIAEREASSELFAVLKRPDEKFVTERAYDNAKFVEDLVRDVAASLERDARIEWYRVEVENFESIHNHSAYAAIEKRAAGSHSCRPVPAGATESEDEVNRPREGAQRAAGPQ